MASTASTMLVLPRTAAGVMAVLVIFTTMLRSVLGSSQVAIAAISAVLLGFFTLGRFASSGPPEGQEAIEASCKVDNNKADELSGDQLAVDLLCQTQPQEIDALSGDCCDMQPVDLERVTLSTEEHRDSDEHFVNVVYHTQLWYADQLVHEWLGEDYACDTFTSQAGVWEATVSEDKTSLSLSGPQGEQTIDVRELIEGHLLGAGCPEPSANLSKGRARRQRRRQRADWLLRREAEMVEAEEVAESEPIIIDNKIVDHASATAELAEPELTIIDNKIANHASATTNVAVPDPIIIENKIFDKESPLVKLPSPCRNNARKCFAEI